jgi:hypothetical protein
VNAVLRLICRKDQLFACEEGNAVSLDFCETEEKSAQPMTRTPACVHVVSMSSLTARLAQGTDFTNLIQMIGGNFGIVNAADEIAAYLDGEVLREPEPGGRRQVPDALTLQRLVEETRAWQNMR